MITEADIRNGYEPPRAEDEVGLDCSNLPDMTRQEFKDETNINNILNRFLSTGIPPAQRQPVFGDRDFDIDLHTGYLAIESAQRAFLRLPDALKEKYKNMQGLLDAIWRGEFKEDLLEETTRPTTEAGGSPPPATQAAADQT